ncbi:MAG: hypothetical protein GY869_03395 [Planctomycetes bacterium]|nr:hypothetical protein [Planctomycetota bacterium]
MQDLITKNEAAWSEENKRLSGLLHLPVFEAFIECQVSMPGGEILHDHRQRSHSWVRNTYNWIFGQLAAKDLDDQLYDTDKYLAIVNLTGGRESGDGAMYVGNACDVGSNGWGYRAGTGVVDQGIVAGTGTDVEDFEDYKLDTIIGHGTGAGQFSYVLGEASVVTFDEGSHSLKCTIVRYMNNNSGGAIDVTEIALYCGGRLVADKNFMVARDLLGAAIEVPNGGQFKVTYENALVMPY